MRSCQLNARSCDGRLDSKQLCGQAAAAAAAAGGGTVFDGRGILWLNFNWRVRCPHRRYFELGRRNVWNRQQVALLTGSPPRAEERRAARRAARNRRRRR